MATASISGLASGLDTDTIITQLMQLEAVPQNRLKTQVTTQQSALTILQNLNSRFASLASRAEGILGSDGLTALKTTSSLSGVTLSATSAADPATFSVTVDQTALSHQLGFARGAALTEVVTGSATTVRLDRLDGTTLDLETGDGTLQGLVKAVNDPANATGLRATAVKDGDGTYRLLVESATTGAAADFDLTAADGTDLLGGATVRAGRDARIDLGAGISVTSATNTFADVVPGVTLTLASNVETGKTGSVSLSRDGADLSTQVKSFVDLVNSALTELDTQTTYNSTTKKSGVLAGDAGVRALRDTLLGAVYPDAGTSMAQYGLQVDRSGKVTFDATKFAEAYKADPDGVSAAMLGGTDQGFLGRIQKVAEAASDKTTGTITTAISGRNSGIKRLTDSIEDWDSRLELRRTTLTRQFTALETALSQMNSQSSWLASQISSLSSSNS